MSRSSPSRGSLPRSLALVAWLAAIQGCVQSGEPPEEAARTPAASAAGGAAAEEEVFSALDSVFARFTRAYELGEPDSVVALYTDDPLYLPAQGDVRRGVEELAGQFAFLQGIRERGERARISFESVDRGTSGDLAYDVGYYTLQVEGADGELSPPSRGKFATVWRRDDDGAWRIHVDSFSPAP